MVGAGSSAREQYGRLRRESRRRDRRRWSGLALAALLAGATAGGAVLVVSWLVDRVLLSFSGPSVSGAFTREVAVAAGLSAVVHLVVRRLRVPPDTRSWATGAAGEERVGAMLATLQPAGWHILHDRRVPGSGGNIDHIAVGPSGVWVIETKSWSGTVEVGVSQLRHNGRPESGVYDQVWRQAAAVAAAAPALRDLHARPVICIDPGRLVIGRDAAGRPLRGPVEFHTPESLLRRIANAPPMLTQVRASAIATELDRGLPHATGEADAPTGRTRGNARARSPTTASA